MNIFIPFSWLEDYLDTDATPSEIAKYLSLCGPSVDRTEKKGNDFVFDVEITTNRVDAMSILGIAREASAILPRFGKKAKLHRINKTNIANNGGPFNHCGSRMMGLYKPFMQFSRRKSLRSVQ